MTLTLVLFVIGFIFLIKGADILVEGSSSIARKFGIPAIVIGLTIVAFGTSAPELVVSLWANIQGSTGIAVGNIIGSNISNILLILGIAVIIRPLEVKKNTVHKEIPLSILAMLAVGFLVNDVFIDGSSIDLLTRIDGLTLLLFFSVFVYYTFGVTRDKENIVEKTVSGLKEEPKEYKLSLSITMVIAGLAGLIVGAGWIVDGAREIAFLIGMSEDMIGLTIVALGTSLPELAASAVAARKGETDIAIGNVMGSNLFNLLWVLGLSAAINPIPFSFNMNLDLLILFVINIILVFLIYIGRKNILARKEGVVLVLMYIVYISFLIYKG